jgi:uncharacterized membrane protein
VNVLKVATFYVSWAVAGGGLFDWLLMDAAVPLMLVIAVFILWVGAPAVLLVAVEPRGGVR